MSQMPPSPESFSTKQPAIISDSTDALILKNPSTTDIAVNVASNPNADANAAPSTATTTNRPRNLARTITVTRAPTRQRKNTSTFTARRMFRMTGSVVPKIALPTILLTAWGTFWTCTFLLMGWTWVSVQPQLITVVSVVLGLLLVFRTNTAYDRYWEARKLWSNLITHSRTLARINWLHVNAKTPQDTVTKHAIMNLIVALSVSSMHHLRNESGYNHEDLRDLISHLPEFSDKNAPNHVDHEIHNIPLQIALHLSSYFSLCRSRDILDVPNTSASITSITGITDAISNFERIRTTPIPLAYSIHLTQTLMLYLLALPFQVVGTMRWVTIPLTFIASFTLLGIETIGVEIENPFGYDPNDLDVEGFCDAIRNEVMQVMKYGAEIKPDMWKSPVKLDDVTQKVVV